MGGSSLADTLGILVRGTGHRVQQMDEFSITRPEPAMPARDSGGQRAPRRDPNDRARPRKTPESPAAPELPSEDENPHQFDELA